MTNQNWEFSSTVVKFQSLYSEAHKIWRTKIYSVISVAVLRSRWRQNSSFFVLRLLFCLLSFIWDKNEDTVCVYHQWFTEYRGRAHIPPCATSQQVLSGTQTPENNLETHMEVPEVWFEKIRLFESWKLHCCYIIAENPIFLVNVVMGT